MQNMMKAQFLAERAVSTPGYDVAKVEQRLLEAMDIPDPQEVFPLDDKGQPAIPPPKNPEFEIQAAEEQRRTLEAHVRSDNNTRMTLAQIDRIEFDMLVESEKLKQSGVQLEVDKFNAMTARLKAHSDAVAKNLKKTEAK
jgi:hypothetical protein